ncbi:hypothetical protein EJ08DRAFT_604314 [Tothia fuscella]|uniref:PAS domain-containing protein n=1 Tax=Tothia fuscella TaxID=1048955 RepID=A0A9P4U2Z7_9PEZI|nr:hypothetical protein EJ08DRAFT_604314 [Tothia fuscella]
MEFPRFRMRKQKSHGALKDRPRISPQIPLTPPKPAIHIEHAPCTINKQHLKVEFMSSTSDRHRLATGDSKPMPTSPTFFDSEEETAVGEPLIQEYAARSIPKEYKPLKPNDHDDELEDLGDFSIQGASPADGSRGRGQSPALDHKGDTTILVRTGSRRNSFQNNRDQNLETTRPRPQGTQRQYSFDSGGNRGTGHSKGYEKDMPVAPWEEQEAVAKREQGQSTTQAHETPETRDSNYSRLRASEETNGHSTTNNHTTINGSSNNGTPEPRKADSIRSFEAVGSTINTLPALQTKNVINEADRLDPVLEDDPGSFDLVLPDTSEPSGFSLEQRSEELVSREHLQEIFNEPALLLQFTAFLSDSRPKSIAVLVYYLDALKSLRAINYANAIAESLEPIEGHEFSKHPTRSTQNASIEEKARLAFDALVQEDLPAFVAHTFIQVASVSIQRRICGTLAPHLREASEGLAEVFCLTDPSRTDNPIVFASEEFHRTTQYGVNYAIGRNCRFLQGPRTNKYSVARLGAAIRAGKEVSEVFLNYRRDGSPFMNLLMVAPLLDSRGVTRYCIGAQVDVSGLCKDCTDLHGLQKMLAKKAMGEDEDNQNPNKEDPKDDFQALTEMFNHAELDTVRRHGGNMHREHVEEPEDGTRKSERPRLLLTEPSTPRGDTFASSIKNVNGRLEGFYQNYLLVRPYPSLRILFSSPSLRVPGILQSPFMNRIGGSPRVREELAAALAEGRGVTAKIRWVSGRHGEEEGRVRWIHCTPLLGSNGSVGVWMVVIVDDETTTPVRRFRTAPPVSGDIGNNKYRNTAFNNRQENPPFGSRQENRPRINGSGANSGMNTPLDRPGSSYSHGTVGDQSVQSFALG